MMGIVGDSYSIKWSRRAFIGGSFGKSVPNYPQKKKNIYIQMFTLLLTIPINYLKEYFYSFMQYFNASDGCMLLWALSPPTSSVFP